MRPAKQALLRERYELGTDEALLFTYVLVAIGVLLLAGQAPTHNIGLWAAGTGITAPLPKLVQSLEVSYRRWFWLQVFAEITNGIMFGSVTLLALPVTDVRQALLCSMLIGVIVGGAVSASQFRTLHLAHLIPFTVTSAVGYLVAPNGLYVAAGFLVVAFLFSVVIAAEHRKVYVHLVDITLENADLVDELAREHTALVDANEQLDQQAWSDALTGLANRAAMNRELQTRLGRRSAGELREPVTVAFLDLNGFKQINDTWGHRTGDLVLVAVADRLGKVIADDELACRLGGDEFVVISSVAAERLAKILARAFEEPLRIGDRALPVRTGIGVATTTEIVSADLLLRNADRALYRHKQNSESGTQWQVFDDSMRAELEHRAGLEAEVRQAFDDGDIAAWFQPVVDLITGEIVGAESLARWAHRDGVRTAAAFIDVLTEDGLLDQLTDRTFEQVEQLQDAVEAAGRRRPRISVNVAPEQLEHALSSRPSRDRFRALGIEITEESAIPDPDRITLVLERARALGAKILVDDFGVGYSSLARTASLPIDGLKIDQSFVAKLTSSLEARAVVSTVVDLAEQLDLIVIAEGVESRAQVDALVELGVPFAQGFFYSAAVTGDELIAWFIEERRFDRAGDEILTEIADEGFSTGAAAA